MKIGQIRSLMRLMDSRIRDNEELVFAIMQGPDITDKQKVKYLENLANTYTYIRSHSLNEYDTLYTRALIEFYPSILNYNGRKRKIDGNKITGVKCSG